MTLKAEHIGEINTLLVNCSFIYKTPHLYYSALYDVLDMFPVKGNSNLVTAS